MTRTEPPRQLGPARFQQRTAMAEERSVLRGLAAGLALLGLVIGVPAALIWLDGAPPVPTSWPTRDDLTSTIGADQLLTVLVLVAWLAWLQLTICVIVELRSAVSGVGLPSRVPLSGPSQRFARLLVGSLLLAVAAAGPATAATASSAGAPPASSVAADAVDAGPASVQLAAGMTVDAEVHEAAGELNYVLGDIVLDADEAAGLEGHNVYRVQPPEGRYHDNLWDIADRHLGDGRRYKEIFELNRGRTQPDGHELSLARLIYPNWLLIMPEDAEGLDRVTAVTAPESIAEPAHRESGQAGVGDAAGAAGAGVAGAAEVAAGRPGAADMGADREGSDRAAVDQVSTDRPGVDQASDAAGPDGASGDVANPSQAFVTAGLLAAGLLAAVELVRRRRHTPPPSVEAIEAEVALRIGADPDRVAWLDRALRGLAGFCQEQQRPLPPVYAAFVDSASVELALAPAAPDPPAPWQALDDGRRWRLDRADATAPLIMGSSGVNSTGSPHDHGGAAAPYPGLVSLGRDGDERDVLIDLEAASGPIAVTGDPTAAYEVVTALAAELATNGWSDHLRVTAAGLPADLEVLGPERLRLVDDVAPFLAELNGKRSDRLGADVLTGRVRSKPSSLWLPEYIVLGSVPADALIAELRALTGGAARSPLGVVCAGDLPGAGWRLEVGAAGNLEVAALGLSVTANRLARPTAVATLIVPERQDVAAPPTRHEAWLPDVRPDVSQPALEADTARLAAAPVRVFVLGPAEVQASGEIDEERRALATEMVIHLALHREGVHPTVLGAALWPRGVTAAVRDAAIDRVRDWLGVAPDGSPYLRSAADGRLCLSDDVVVDWEVVQTLLARSRVARSRDEEVELLRGALRVARGPVLSERPRGRFAWLARVRLERTASDLLVDAAHRLSMLCFDRGDPGTAAAAARAGIRVRPGEQLLWRDLLQVEHARGGRAGVDGVLEQLTQVLSSIGVADLEPETTALLDEYLPDGRATGHEL